MTDEEVEAAARAIALCAGEDPDDIWWTLARQEEHPAWMAYMPEARAALAAAEKVRVDQVMQRLAESERADLSAARDAALEEAAAYFDALPWDEWSPSGVARAIRTLKGTKP